MFEFDPSLMVGDEEEADESEVVLTNLKVGSLNCQQRLHSLERTMFFFPGEFLRRVTMRNKLWI